MYYLAHVPPLVGGSVVDPGALELPIPQGAQEEFGYRTTAGMGTVCSRTGFGQLAATGLSGIIQLSYFRAPRSQAITRWDMAVTAAAFGATPTLIRGGLYIVDDTDNLVLIGASANNTGIGTALNSKFGAALATPSEVHFGQRYAYGFLFVTAATAPTLLGVLGAAGSSNVSMLSSPRVNGWVTGQADLPVTIAAASVAASNLLFWSELS